MSAKKISVLVSEPMAPEGLAILNDHPNFVIDVCLDLSPRDLLQKIENYECLLVRSQTLVDENVISAGKKLQLIGRAGVGIDNIDIASAKANNIAVINTPSGNSISTAELAFGLMISLARKIPFAFQHVRENKWQRSNFKGIELFKKTLGIIGFGNVGKQLATRARAFEMRVIAFDPLVENATFLEHDVENVSIDQLFLEADFISLHCGLNDVTKNLINEKNIAKMKNGMILINTARGELVDNEALISGLNSGKIACAALDVFRVEPPVSNDPVVHHPKVLVTPHIGASTDEAQKRVSTLLAEQTVGFFSGQKNLTRIV